MKRTKKQIREEAARAGDDGDEVVYDQVTGARGKKTILSALNKTKISDYEMDEIFAGEYW